LIDENLTARLNLSNDIIKKIAALALLTIRLTAFTGQGNRKQHEEFFMLFL